MSRATVLEQIRRSLHRQGPLAAGVADALRARLGAPPLHPQPAWDEDPVARFMARAEAVAASTARCAGPAELSAAVLRYLDDGDLPARLVSAEDELLAEVSWSNRLSVSHGLPTDADLVSVTTAFAGVAETGTVVMLSAAHSPTTLNFLPAVHIVVLRRARIVRHQEDVWALIRRELGRLPRNVNFITGPSRTGDVEQVLQLGAHGPRLLHVIVLDD